MTPTKSEALAWEQYAAGSDVQHFADFCQEHLLQSIDDFAGLPLVLEPFQHDIFGEAMAFGESFDPIWRSIVIVMPRKNGKTASLAAYALYRLLTSDGSPEILLVASSDKQADKLFKAASSYIRKSPVLSSLCRIRDHVGEIVREDGDGIIYRLSSDPKRLHGYNPSLVVCDELAQWVTPSLKAAFAALTSGGGARRAPQVFTITTAGEARYREDSILGRMLDQSMEKGDVEAQPGRSVARFWPAKMLLFNYEAPTKDPFDLDAMKLANPASWITREYLLEQAEDPELSDADVLQLHGCVWATGESHWLPEDAWRACKAEDRSGWPADGEDVVIGFDGSYNNDSTALVGCTLDGYIFEVKVWENEHGDRRWKVPRQDVRNTVDDAMRRWNVIELACDPWIWHQELEDWAETYGEAVAEYDTRQRKLISSACSRFFKAVAYKELSHDGSKTIAAHLSHAHTKKDGDLEWIVKEATKTPRKIDAAMAAVIAYDRAMQAANIEPLVAFG